MRNRTISAVLFALALCAPQHVMAWDDHSHRIVALVAAHFLTPEARTKVENLLASDRDRLTAHNIPAAATWADKYMRAHPETAEWHFADIQANKPSVPDACFGHPSLPAGTPASQGPANACIIDKIHQFWAELADPRTGNNERRIALKYLLHLVGDLHQPLHVSDEGNEHGKNISVSASSITPGDLFGYWDIAIPRQLGVNPEQVAAELIANISNADQGRWSTHVPHLWALEAHQIGVDTAYGTMLSDMDANGRFVIYDEEVDKAANIIATQLSKAGVRLALILNDSLAPSTLAKAPRSEVPWGDPGVGRALSQALCSTCHVIAPDQIDARQYTTAPNFEAVANTTGMTEDVVKDFLFGTHPTMPAIGLTGDQASDVASFILSLRSRR
jgi:hypothetical protein